MARTRGEHEAVAPWVLAAVSFAVAFAQRPGEAFTDSRIELTADPGRFLGRIADVWSSTGDLGHVAGGLFAGYLFPMGPWYVGADLLGVPDWIAQRVWLGLLLSLAAWGVLHLLRAIHPGRVAAHAAGALVYALSAYVVTSLAVRGTIPLLAYAALPWLVLCVHRGLGHPRGWVWPAAVAALVAASGGAINAAHVLWMLVAAAAFALYEVAVLRRGARGDLWSLAWRSGVCVVAASLWWLVPLALQGGVGADFQQFAEHPGAIWQTTSLSESLRLLGFWVLYLGSGFSGTRRPELDVGEQLLFSAPVVVATLLVGVAALAGVRIARGWRYTPLFGLLAVFGLLVMAAGFPPGTPLRRALLFLNDEVRSLEVVRTTYKAAPVVALAYAALTAAAVQRLNARQAWASAAVALVAVVAALPLIQGRALDADTAYDEIPSWWRAAVDDADRSVRPEQRVVVLPGALFASYRWGFTTTSIAPAIADRPVTIRETIRYADPRSAQLLDATDDLVQQERAVPGQLGSLLALMGAGRVLVPADGDPVRTGELPPAEAARSLATDSLFARPLREYGPRRAHPPLAGRSGSGMTLPELRAYPGPRNAGGAVRVMPTAGAVVLEGDAEGVAELAAHGMLDPGRALHYAGDVGRSELGRLVGAGAEVVFTDTGQRRFVSAARLRNNHGPTLTAEEELPGDAAHFDLFGSPAHRTTARYSGLVRLTGGLQASLPQFPEHRPYAAFDGRPDTSWIPRGHDEEAKALHVELARPRAVPAIRLRPHVDRSGRTMSVGVAVNGGRMRDVRLREGWNAIAVGRAPVRRLELRVREVESSDPDDELPGGLAEVDIPGLRVRELLRLPTGLAADARGLALERTPVTVLLRRTTADLPYRAGAGVVAAQRLRPTDMVDAEPGLEREVTLPVARTFSVDGWGSAAPAGNDSALDRLVGVPVGWRLESSSRFEGLPGRRASSALDGDRRTAWVGDWPSPRPWLSVRAPHAFAAERLRLAPGPAGYARPATVRVRAGRRTTGALAVGRDGVVRLPFRTRSRELRIEVLTVRRPGGRRLAGVAIAEIEASGLGTVRPQRRGEFRSRCGAITVIAARPGGAPGPAVPAVVEGSVGDLDAGRPLRFRGCGAGVALPAGASWVSAPPGAFRADHLRLRSGAPQARPLAPGAVTHHGEGWHGRRDGVRLALRSPAWLVLAESYSRGWRAWCGERDLGTPSPVAGFANGWRVPASCTDARFEFAPQAVADWSYAASLLVALVFTAILVGAARRRRRAGPGTAPAAIPGPDGTAIAGRIAPGSWRRALVAGAVVALVGGFVFALRAGPPLGLVALLITRYGVGSRRLVTAGAAALAVVPILYVVFTPNDLGGYNFAYGVELLGAHWVTAGALCAIGLGCVLDLREWRRR